MVEWRNHGTAENHPKSWNRGITERRKIPPNPKRRNHGKAERRTIPPNPKRRNDGKSPEILKDGIAEKQPKSLKTESRSSQLAYTTSTVRDICTLAILCSVFQPLLSPHSCL